MTRAQQTSALLPSGIPGSGGNAAITGNVTLTNTSAGAMVATPATYGLYATLPDATTCTKGTAPFSIYNAGDFDYGVKDSTGTQLGWIRPGTGAVIGLADNSAAAGVWAYYGLIKTGITANYRNSSLANMNSYINRVALDATRTCFVFGGTDCYAIVYDSSSQTWGSSTLVRSGVSTNVFSAVLSATNQVLVVSNDGTTAMEAVTLTISGTGVTVNSGTKATATLAGSINVYGKFIAVGASWVLAYGRATNVTAIRAISVSGTTPTIGNEAALSGAVSTAPTIFASGSVVRCFSNDSSNIYAAPYTVSGVTLTLGTATSTGITTAGFRAFVNGNGNVVCHYLNTQHWACIFKLTGTTEAASSVNIGTAPTTLLSNSDCIAITASKTLFASFVTATGVYLNILTDTAGTASAGTELATTTNVTTTSIACQFVVGTTGYTTVGNNNGTYLFSVNCSAATPTINNYSQVIGGGGQASDRYNIRYGAASPAAGKIVTLSQTAPVTLTVSGAVQVSAGGVNIASFGSSQSVSDGANGAWGSLTGGISNSGGITIQHMEAAA